MNISNRHIIGHVQVKELQKYKESNNILNPLETGATSTTFKISFLTIIF